MYFGGSFLKSFYKWHNHGKAAGVIERSDAWLREQCRSACSLFDECIGFSITGKSGARACHFKGQSSLAGWCKAEGFVRHAAVKRQFSGGALPALTALGVCTTDPPF